MSEKDCPCQTVRNLQALTAEQEKRLAQGSVNFAVINTKLNIVMGILGAVGVAIAGVVVKMAF